MSETKNDSRTATQRIEDLENVLTTLYQATLRHDNAMGGLAGLKNDMTLVKDALKLINRRVEGVIQSAKPESGITADSVAALVTQMTVIDLKQQVANYVTAGHLAPTDTVTDNTFVVCEEYDSAGILVNPRVQFRLDSQDPSTQETLKGKKFGDTASFGEGKFSVKVLEVYSLLDPTAQAAPQPTEAAPAPDNTTGPTEAATVSEDSPATTAAAPSEAPRENESTFGLSYHGTSDPYTVPASSETPATT